MRRAPAALDDGVDLRRGDLDVLERSGVRTAQEGAGHRRYVVRDPVEDLEDDLLVVEPARQAARRPLGVQLFDVDRGRAPLTTKGRRTGRDGGAAGCPGAQVPLERPSRRPHRRVGHVEVGRAHPPGRPPIALAREGDAPTRLTTPRCHAPRPDRFKEVRDRINRREGSELLAGRGSGARRGRDVHRCHRPRAQLVRGRRRVPLQRKGRRPSRARHLVVV